jgi:hypothetical protein
MTQLDTNTTSDDGHTPEVNAGRAGLSVLDNLATRRQQIREDLTEDIPVPRWTDPEIVVKFAPIDHDDLNKARTVVTKAQRGARSVAEIHANCDILIKACKGVVAVIDGEEYSLRVGDRNGEPTLFDPDLAAALGLDGENATARQTVRALYLTDGDIIATADRLVRWSGYRLQQVDRELEGE